MYSNRIAFNIVLMTAYFITTCVTFCVCFPAWSEWPGKTINRTFIYKSLPGYEDASFDHCEIKTYYSDNFVSVETTLVDTASGKSYGPIVVNSTNFKDGNLAPPEYNHPTLSRSRKINSKFFEASVETDPRGHHIRSFKYRRYQVVDKNEVDTFIIVCDEAKPNA